MVVALLKETSLLLGYWVLRCDSLRLCLQYLVGQYKLLDCGITFLIVIPSRLISVADRQLDVVSLTQLSLTWPCLDIHTSYTEVSLFM